MRPPSTYYAVEVRLVAVLLLLGWLWTRIPEPLPGPPVSAPLALDVNAASLEALRALPGVGRKTAAQLVAGRPYASWAGVEARLGRSRFARCRPWLRLDVNLEAGSGLDRSARTETAR